MFSKKYFKVLIKSINCHKNFPKFTPCNCKFHKGMHEIIFTPLHSLKDQIQAVTSKAWLCAAKYCIKQLAQKI